jgi:hypothetical protein
MILRILVCSFSNLISNIVFIGGFWLSNFVRNLLRGFLRVLHRNFLGLSHLLSSLALLSWSGTLLVFTDILLVLSINKDQKAGPLYHWYSSSCVE